jgi:hypothetical protein
VVCFDGCSCNDDVALAALFRFQANAGPTTLHDEVLARRLEPAISQPSFADVILGERDAAKEVGESTG